MVMNNILKAGFLSLMITFFGLACNSGGNNGSATDSMVSTPADSLPPAEEDHTSVPQMDTTALTDSSEAPPVVP